MLTLEEDVQVGALRKRGWSISAIARHLGRDRKTVRAYVNGERVLGRRARSVPDGFAVFVPYVRTRLGDDPHVWVSTLLDELAGLGWEGGYSTLTRQIRDRGLRPHCEPCKGSRGRDHAIIAHPAGEETQFDWVELPGPPGHWGFGALAHVLVGTLSCSGKWAAVICESEDQPHLVAALHKIVTDLGGVTGRWRFDRMATVCDPGTGRISRSFAQVAKHYGVEAVLCPPRHGNRKGVVEKANHSMAQRWWRTLPDEATVEQAQSGLEEFCRRGDDRKRRRDGIATTVGELAAAEPLAAPPDQPFPLTVEVTRKVTAQALVAFGGNFYSVPPGMGGQEVTVAVRLGEQVAQIATAGGIVVAAHRLAPAAAGVIVRDAGHVAALENAVLAGFSDRKPCNSKARRPPSAAALAEANRLREAAGAEPGQVVTVDFGAYISAAQASATGAAPASDPGTSESSSQ